MRQNILALQGELRALAVEVKSSPVERPSQVAQRVITVKDDVQPFDLRGSFDDSTRLVSFLRNLEAYAKGAALPLTPALLYSKLKGLARTSADRIKGPAAYEDIVAALFRRVSPQKQSDMRRWFYSSEQGDLSLDAFAQLVEDRWYVYKYSPYTEPTESDTRDCFVEGLRSRLCSSEARKQTVSNPHITLWQLVDYLKMVLPQSQTHSAPAKEDPYPCRTCGGNHKTSRHSSRAGARPRAGEAATDQGKLNTAGNSKARPKQRSEPPSSTSSISGDSDPDHQGRDDRLARAIHIALRDVLATSSAPAVGPQSSPRSPEWGDPRATTARVESLHTSSDLRGTRGDRTRYYGGNEWRPSDDWGTESEESFAEEEEDDWHTSYIRN
jgi:hypothetical protein